MSSCFSMGPNTFEVSIQDVFVANRKKLVDRLHCQSQAAASATAVSSPTTAAGEGGGGIVFLQGGPSVTRFDSDHEPIFRQESYFWYLTGVKEPDCSIAIDSNTLKTILFVPKLPADYATIMGRIWSTEEWREHYLVDQVKYTEEIEETLLELLEKNKNEIDGRLNGNGSINAGAELLLMKGRNSDSGNVYEPPTFTSEKLRQFIDTTTLFPILAECRVVKSPAELQLLRHVTEITSFAHAYVMRNFKVGMMEYQAESLFRHYCYYNYGSRLVGYTPICGCGPSAAVLHYGHAGEPNARQSSVNDMCLMDMGAEYFCYGSDVTCSFPACGIFTEQHKIIYHAVLNAQVAVYDMMKPGVSYVDCHKAAEAEIVTALIHAGLLRNIDGKTVGELIELRLGAVFMPHGLGHFIGIDTHDVGGYLPGHPERIDQPGLRKLRTARILQENMTLTVEPGCYFIDHLLDEAAKDPVLSKYLVMDKIAEYRDFGGVRLEDVVQITSDSVINYTLCPRTMAEVESVMSGGKWPPMKDEAPQLRRLRLTDPTPLPSPPSF